MIIFEFDKLFSKTFVFYDEMVLICVIHI